MARAPLTAARFYVLVFAVLFVITLVFGKVG